MTTATASATLAASPLVWALECVRLPGPRGPVAFRPYPYQATLLADRSPRQIVLKARQTGITTVAAIVEAHEAIHQPRSDDNRMATGCSSLTTPAHKHGPPSHGALRPAAAIVRLGRAAVNGDWLVLYLDGEPARIRVDTRTKHGQGCEGTRRLRSATAVIASGCRVDERWGGGYLDFPRLLPPWNVQKTRRPPPN